MSDTKLDENSASYIGSVADTMRAKGISKLSIGDITIELDFHAPMGPATQLRRDFENSQRPLIRDISES